MKLLDSDMKVDLLFTDIVMPGGLNGKELAKKAREKRSNLKVLFTSGYPKLCNGDDSPLEAGDSLLSKPYRKRDLAKVVHQILN